MLKYQEIFVPGGFPRHTYNPRVNLQLEARLGEVRENLCKLVTVTGQTKSGKTVLTRKVLPDDQAIWIDGGTVSKEDDFWHVIIDHMGLTQSIQNDDGAATTATIGGRASAGANFLVAKGQAEIETNLEKERSSGTSTTRTVSARVTALRGLKEVRRPLVVDDFHYLPREMQGSIVRALKPLIFDGQPVAIIAIPHRRYDALKVEREMTGRISPVEIPVWSSDELRYIPDTGFGLLNYRPSERVALRLADEAIGSPHLMQDFCRHLSRHLQLAAAPTPTLLDVEDHQLESVFREVAETIGRPIFEKLARGPQRRSDRIPRKMIGGRVGDIYVLVLVALAHIRPGLVSIEYEELRAAVRAVSIDQVPQLQEIARVLKQMATIAATDQSSTPVIDFEEQDKKLHITDPFFAFYLRWGELTRPGDAVNGAQDGLG